MLIIRHARPGDEAPLAALAERTFRDTFADRNTPENLDRHCAAHFGSAIQQLEIADSGLVTMLAEEAGSLIGFSQLRLSQASASVVAERPAELNRIYVASGWHGRGVAQGLMQDAIATATEAGSDCLWLGVWEHNPRAIAFYRKFGFREVGEHMFMLGGDRQRDVIMVADLG